MTNNLHLRNAFSYISGIYITDDISYSHYYTEDIDDDIGDNRYLSYTDKMLSELSADVVHAFTNIELLDRIAKIDINLLTAEQISLLQSEYAKKYIIDKEDVQDFLNKLKSCYKVFFAERHKNTSFIAKYDLSIEDCISILRSLTVADYYRNTKSINLGKFGNNLIIFEKERVNIKGKLLNIIIYIKIDVDQTDNTATTIISFHATNDKNDLPYKNGEFMNMKNRLNEDIIRINGTDIDTDRFAKTDVATYGAVVDSKKNKERFDIAMNDKNAIVRDITKERTTKLPATTYSRKLHLSESLFESVDGEEKTKKDRHRKIFEDLFDEIYTRLCRFEGYRVLGKSGAFSDLGEINIDQYDEYTEIKIIIPVNDKRVDEGVSLAKEYAGYGVTYTVRKRGEEIVLVITVPTDKPSPYEMGDMPNIKAR